MFCYVFSLWADSIESISDVNIVAATLILEAGGESDERAMEAVYEVIRNRVEKRNMSERKVVFQRLQFSCWNNTEKRLALYKKAVRHPKFLKARDIVINDNDTNYTLGADHYHANFVTPYWADTLTHTTTIENHIFYK